jgi:hypothetical protein
VATLLFLGVVGLQRPWQLRSYSGDGLALLSGRSRTYGYEYSERFLAQVTQAGGDQACMVAVAQWSHQLWGTSQGGVYYVDMHRKPVYSALCLPRGLIGRSGKVLGCRALALLQDALGHPLLITTQRGDTHLTQAFPQLLQTAQQAVGAPFIHTVVLDREGMGAAFLHSLQGQCTVITLLRSNQYSGESSFTAVGAFMPLRVDAAGKVLREVAPASFCLPSPEQPAEPLTRSVALIRDWSRPVASGERHAAARSDGQWDEAGWWEAEAVAQPLPSATSAPKLIPIVATGAVADVVELVATYQRRWPAQENIIRDFLLPLGLDTNHGYAKRAVINSEVAKRRQTTQTQLSNVRRWKARALDQSTRTSQAQQRRWQQAKAHSDALYRQLPREQLALEQAGLSWAQCKQHLQAKRRAIEAELEPLWAKTEQARQDSNRAWEKAHRYAHKERHLLRKLADLDRQEKQMYELDNRKDQLMTTLRVALTNLVMWTRDHFFPAPYAHATWQRLAPFFQLPGHIVEQAETCVVYLRSFNDRQLNRDLDALCARVNSRQPPLPDGRSLRFFRLPFDTPIPDMQP